MSFPDSHQLHVKMLTAPRKHFNTIAVISFIFHVLVLNTDLHKILKSYTQLLYLTKMYCQSYIAQVSCTVIIFSMYFNALQFNNIHTGTVCPLHMSPATRKLKLSITFQ